MTDTASKTKEEFWRVVRQDSNGVQAVERERLTREAADAFVKLRTKQIGDHKQTVWAERMPEPEPK